MRRFPPERIVCLTEETVETLYLLGEEDRIVGVSGYAVRPPRVRREKPRVSAFTSADTTKILALAPDLVLAFSDLQAGIVQDLARAGLAVHLFNQRDVAGILAMVRTLGALIDRRDAANTLADSLARRLEAIAREQQHRSPRPRVFFEEWDEPLIAGIGWISELIEIAGGDDVCCHLRAAAAAKDRIVTPDAIAATRPDVILASWCGKKVVPDRIRSRPWLGSDPRRCREPHLRDQVAADSTARTRSAHRRPRRHSCCAGASTTASMKPTCRSSARSAPPGRCHRAPTRSACSQGQHRLDFRRLRLSAHMGAQEQRPVLRHR